MVGYRKRKNPLKNGMWQLVIVTVGSVLWDIFTGWQGWSVDYVVPLAILVNMLSMIIISAAGKMEVSEYLFYLVQAGVSLLFLLGLAIFKWKDLVREVQKKFRV